MTLIIMHFKVVKFEKKNYINLNLFLFFIYGYLFNIEFIRQGIYLFIYILI
jgi:hypothetical protein